VDGAAEGRNPPSRVKPLPPEKIKQVVHMTLHEKPPNATHLSVRSMAAAAGISYSSVQRIWHAHGLKPHLIQTFKVSCDDKRNGTSTLFAALNMLDGTVIGTSCRAIEIAGSCAFSN
jgi:hypothetical protein